MRFENRLHRWCVVVLQYDPDSGDVYSRLIVPFMFRWEARRALREFIVIPYYMEAKVMHMTHKRWFWRTRRWVNAIRSS